MTSDQTIRARAVRIEGKGGPEVLRLGEIDVRAPGPGEARVRVRAAGLNRADCLQRKGVYPAPPGVVPDVPGLEFAGEVESVGDGVRDVAVGDRVMGISAGAAQAEYLVAHARELLPVPAGISLEDAGAIPEVFLTAYDAMVLQAGLSAGDRVLVHAAASGVGTAAVQIARALHAFSIGTSRSASKLEAVRELGMDVGVETSSGSFRDGVKAAAPAGVDVVLDTIGAKYLAENLKVLAPGGRIVTIGLLGGAKAELPLGLLVSKRARLMGSVLRARPLEEKIQLARAARRALLPLFESGALRPVVEGVVPMADVADAHARMEAASFVGKLVLTW